MAFENREDFDLFKERDVLSRLPDRVAQLEREVKALKEESRASKEQISTLTITSDGYLSTRNAICMYFDKTS